MEHNQTQTKQPLHTAFVTGSDAINVCRNRSTCCHYASILSRQKVHESTAWTQLWLVVSALYIDTSLVLTKGVEKWISTNSLMMTNAQSMRKKPRVSSPAGKATGQRPARMSKRQLQHLMSGSYTEPAGLGGSAARKAPTHRIKLPRLGKGPGCQDVKRPIP